MGPLWPLMVFQVADLFLSVFANNHLRWEREAFLQKSLDQFSPLTPSCPNTCMWAEFGSSLPWFLGLPSHLACAIFNAQGLWWWLFWFENTSNRHGDEPLQSACTASLHHSCWFVTSLFLFTSLSTIFLLSVLYYPGLGMHSMSFF